MRLKKMLLCLTMLFFIMACNHSTFDKPVDYKYGLVYTSYSKPESKIVLLSEKLKPVKTIAFKKGGLQSGVIKGDHYYNPAVGTNSTTGHDIIDLDLSTLRLRFIHTDDFPMDLDVDDKNRYMYAVHNSGFDSGTLTKIDIKRNKIVARKTLNGTLRQVKVYKGKVYVASDRVDEHFQSVYVLTTDLKLKKQLINRYTGAPNDLAVAGKQLFIINNAKSDMDQATNELVSLSLDDEKLHRTALKAYDPWQMLQHGDDQYVTHYNSSADEGNKVTVITKQGERIVTLQNNLWISRIADGRFYSSDGLDLYIYHLNDFKLIKKKSVRSSRYVLYDFFIKP